MNMMKEDMRILNLTSIALLLFSLIVSSCTTNTDMNITVTTAAGGTVTGRVIDMSTLMPVTGATVALIFNGTKKTTTTSSDPDPDLSGTFAISGIPSGTHVIKVTAPDYAVYERPFSAYTYASNYMSDNHPFTVNLGSITMGKAFDLTVKVTDAGWPVSGITVNATSWSWSYTGVYPVSAVTDTNGQAVLKGLDIGQVYNVCSTPTYDATGTSLKYLSSCIKDSCSSYNSYCDSTYEPVSSTRFVSIALTSAMNNDYIALVADNLMHFNGSFSAAKTKQAVSFVYNYPVNLTGNVTVSYLNTLVTNTSADYNKTLVVGTATPTLDPTNTILTITNSNPWTTNQTYSIDGAVTALVNGQIISQRINTSFYIADDTITGLSPSTVLVADNYDGSSGVPSSVATQVYVNFPEFVYGTYRIISSATGTTQTTVAGNETFLPAGEVVRPTNLSGKDSNAVYRVPMSVLMSNATSTIQNNITIHFDVYDAEGNALSNDVTLDVQ